MESPLHDHAGNWCVECVYRGTIEVVPYRLLGEHPDGTLSFTQEDCILAGVGTAGSLIPPYEHHTIANRGEGPAVTIHVYRGEMESCRVFLPVGPGRWRPEEKVLTYSS